MNQAATWREETPPPERRDQNGWLSNGHIAHPSLVLRLLLALSPREGKLPSNPTAGSTVSSGDTAAELQQKL